MTESERENVQVPEVLDEDTPMPELLTAEDIEYLEESFEGPEELSTFYEAQVKPQTPIDNVETMEAYKSAYEKGMEVGVAALAQAVKIRAEREKKFDRTDWNDLPGYLNSVRSEINFRVTALKHQVFEIGKLIYEAKAFLAEYGRNKSEEGRMRAKGYFSQWLNDNFPLSRSTALNCVRVYKACLGYEEAVQYFGASTLYLMSEPRFPKKVREYLLQNVNERFQGKRAEILDMVAKLQSGQIEFGGPEMKRILGNSLEHSVATQVVREFSKLESALKGHRKALEDMQNRSLLEPLLPNGKSSKDHVLYKKGIELIDELLENVQSKKREMEEAEGLVTKEEQA